MTPDARPIMGRVADGLIVATGHGGQGVILAGGTAPLVSALLLEQDRSPGKVAAPGPLGDPSREGAPGDGVARPSLDKGGIRGRMVGPNGDQCRYAAGHHGTLQRQHAVEAFSRAAWDLKMGGICPSIVTHL